MTQAKRLSTRLSAVLDLLKPCHCLADIGSDHGYLICEAVLAGKASRGVAVELSQDPYQQTVLAVVEAFLMDEVSVRLGDGLGPLHMGEADALCIAGMGGKTIADILCRGREKLESVKQLVLQPNVDAGKVRSCLKELGFVAEDETLVSDGGFIYQIISAAPKKNATPQIFADRLCLMYGEHNLARGGALMRTLVERDVAHLESVAAQLLRARDGAGVEKRHDVLSQIAQLRSYLAKMAG
jgi:tRNA (adenine22-N1)-methyltransferase